MSEQLILIARLLSVVDAAISVTQNSAELRQLFARAVAEGRDLTDAELDSLKSDAQDVIDKLK